MKNIIILLLLTLVMASCKPTGLVPDKQTIYTVNGPCLIAVANHQGGATDTAYLWNDIDIDSGTVMLKGIYRAIDFRQPKSFTVNTLHSVIDVGVRFYYSDGSGVITIHRLGEGEWQIQPDTTSITDNLGRAWCRVKREQ